jgi:hypothetical protein
MNSNNEIESQLFINSFFRLGLKEKSKRRKEKIQLDREIAKQKIEFENMKIQNQISKLDIEIDITNYTNNDYDNAIEKIKSAALLYDKSKSNVISLGIILY